MNITKKSKLLAAIFAIAFIAYNVILFVICGFSGHNGSFWVSWMFMITAFLAIGISLVILSRKGVILRDWLFNYPVYKHCLIYFIAEFIISTLFVIFNHRIKWGWAFAPQFLLLCVFAILVLSCLFAKETITEVHEEVSDKTRFVKLLRADTDMLMEKCDDGETREMCKKLSEAIRFSDPMSNEVLFELEKEISLTVSECDRAVWEKDYTAAKSLLEKAMLQLTERNKKCKALK